MRSWRIARAATQTAWGCQPVAIVAARAVSGVQRCAARPARSVVGRIFRWRSIADVEALKTMGDGRLGPWSRHKEGRPKLRWEVPWLSLAGSCWWDSAEGWHWKTVVGAILAADPGREGDAQARPRSFRGRSRLSLLPWPPFFRPAQGAELSLASPMVRVRRRMTPAMGTAARRCCGSPRRCPETRAHGWAQCNMRNEVSLPEPASTGPPPLARGPGQMCRPGSTARLKGWSEERFEGCRALPLDVDLLLACACRCIRSREP